MSITNPIARFYANWKSRDEVRLLIPMGYVPGYPVLTVRGDQLVSIIPFLKYKSTGEIDRTLVFPVRYTLEYMVPELRLVSYRDLTVDPSFSESEFATPTGFFRHEAIRHLDRERFESLRARTFDLYDKLICALTDSVTVFTTDDENALRSNLQTLTEPSLKKQYEILSPDFYNKFIAK